MSRTRHQGKRDANHGEIVAAFRHVGYSVLDLGAVGDGCPDICVGKFGISRLCEIKSAVGKLTDDQSEFQDRWEGDYNIVRSVDDVLSLSKQWIVEIKTQDYSAEHYQRRIQIFQERIRLLTEDLVDVMNDVEKP